MILSNIFLQLEDLLTTKGGEGPSILEDIIFPVIVAGIALFLGWKIYDARKSRKSYPEGPGVPIGNFTFIIQDNVDISGFVKKIEIVDIDEVEEILRGIPSMKPLIPEFKKIQNEKLYNLYKVRRTEVRGISDILSKGQDLYVISIGYKIESDEVATEEDLGGGSPFAKITDRRKKILCSSATRIHHVETADGLKDAIVLSVFPKPEKGKIYEIIRDGDNVTEKMELVVKTVSNTSNWAKAILHMENVVIAEEKIKAKNERIDEMLEQITDLENKLLEFQRRDDVYRLRLAEQKLIGFTSPFSLPFRGEPWGWHVMFAVSPMAGWLLGPEISSQVQPWMSAAMGFAIIAGIRFISLRGQRKADDEAMAQAMT